LLREHGPGRPQDRAQASGGHAHLVKLLGVLADSRAGVVRADGLELRAQHGQDAVEGRRGRIGRFESDGEVESERAEELRRALAVDGAALAELGTETLEALVVARADQLDLDL